ncbi:MAG: TetR/AcrR family transcriptional regulator [Shimia sp.]|uniref:TetR/AcrR family transcriptional regulator n=1 Tax=Shimia sp. TaxID=1954381 RepID=UPI004059DC5D
MAKKLNNYHHGDLSRALVQAGRDALQDEGIDKLSLRSVAARVGVSRTAPYAHFSDKNTLLRAICASGFAELSDAMQTCANDDLHPREQIIAFGEAYVQFALDHPNLYRLMISTLAPESDAEGEMVEGDSLRLEATRPFALLQAQFSRMVKDPTHAETLSQGAWSVVHGMASLLGEGLITAPAGGAGEILRTLMDTQVRPAS